MIKFLPILLAVGYGLLVYYFSAARSKRELDAKSTPLAHEGFEETLDPMARALDLPRIQVNIYEIEQVNGLAAADGRIFITRGFFDRFEAGEVTGDELASVVAHELGHVALGHSKRRIIDFSGQNAMRTAIGMVLSRFVPFVGYWLANMAMSLLAARLSRQDEYEADAYASALLIKSGIGTEGQKSLFEKLEHLSGMRGSGPPAWLRSHPHSPDRIKAIEANEAKWLSPEPSQDGANGPS